MLGAIPIGTVGDVKENTITMREHVPFAIHTDEHVNGNNELEQVISSDEE